MTVRVVNSSDAPLKHGRRGAAHVGAGVHVFVVLLWLVLIPRIIPEPRDDRGIFVSVAERILAGDVLYRDVWDNKDPLFFYGIALTRAVSPYADVLLELAWIALSALAVLVIAHSQGCNPRAALFVSFGMVPIILTGGFYFPGYTHLPGIALSLCALAAAMSNRFCLAGAVLGLLLFTKIVMIPIGFLMLLAVVIVHRRWAAILRVITGFCLSSAVVIGALHIRGELEPYFQSLLLNVAYSQSSLVDDEWGSFVGHLLRVISVQLALVVALICAIIVWAVWDARRRSAGISAGRRSLVLWAALVSSLLGAIVALGATGMWNHHAQVLYVAAVLASVIVIQRYQGPVMSHAVLTISWLTCMAILLSGPMSPYKYVEIVTNSPQALSRLGAVPAVSQSISSLRASGTYARVGPNDDSGHAYGLGAWNLECPRFHQYAFDSERSLHDALACLPNAEVILVSPKAVPVVGMEPWNAYLRDVELLLRDNYSCDQTVGQRVCVRRA